VTRYPLAALAVMEEFHAPGAFDDEGLPVLVMRKQMRQPWEAGGIMMAGRRGTRCP
jgi:hypothetical protein